LQQELHNLLDNIGSFPFIFACYLIISFQCSISSVIVWLFILFRSAIVLSVRLLITVASDQLFDIFKLVFVLSILTALRKHHRLDNCDNRAAMMLYRHNPWIVLTWSHMFWWVIGYNLKRFYSHNTKLNDTIKLMTLFIQHIRCQIYLYISVYGVIIASSCVKYINWQFHFNSKRNIGAWCF